MSEQRNVILAVILSIAILLGYQYFFMKPVPQQAVPPQQPAVSDSAAPEAPAGVAPGAESAQPAQTFRTREEVVAEGDRVSIDTPRLKGSISLVGGRLDDLTLATYKETEQPDSPDVTLLSPSGAPKPYFVEMGWSTSDTAVKLPNAQTRWSANGAKLTPSTPVELWWDNGEGLTFIRTLAVDERYVFTVTQRVENSTGRDVTLYPYGLIARVGLPKLEGYSVLHEGPLGVVDGKLEEVKYDKLKDTPFSATTTGGWVGITDKYWLTALLFDQGTQVQIKFAHRTAGGVDRYQVDYLAAGVTVPAGQSKEVTNRVFAGAKEVKTISAYEEKFGIDKFDRAIDFGWFYFLTKPFFYILDYLYKLFGNFGLAILGFVVLLRLAMFPLANKSYRSMNAMKRVQPELKKLQERHKDDKARLQQEMMSLYKREKANPMSGCLPMLIQIPVFFALYKVLFITIEMRHAPFYGWITDLSAPDPTNVFTLFGLIPWTPPELMHLGIWPLLMGISMWLLQKMSPTPPDPTQAKIMQFLPIIFTFMLAKFAAGLVIYWAFSNCLSILQQYVLLKTEKPLAHHQHPKT
ncbi:Membrane protein insertase YidC [uncultured Alphaproteobacteria bacterium]|uniref:Membrane protein insertase YidC n=1 Tax=uncultured Alphaproteobacteria bacterium TaxID=91750 RepID=A0A212KKU9_9PROT|nr:Membrane protein insertase YidC [uncultured Alphaproteobacteria bacterium]